MGLLKEFRDFAMKGNVLDMAIGLIIGAEFGKIVNSMLNDILMPPLGKLIGGVNFSDLKFSLGQTVEKAADGKETVKEAFLNYGSFLQTCLNFTIIAFAVFMIVKAKNTAEARLRGPVTPGAPPPPPEDVQLLREIRDSLRR